MRLNRLVRGMGATALMAIAGCHSLDIANPNEPDANRALSDPKAIEALAGGAMQTWFNAYTGLRSAGVLSTQARSFSSSWNNGNLNFYSGIDLGPTDTVTAPSTWTRNTRAWQNNPSAAARTSIDAFWGGGLDESAISRPGFYSSLASANNALNAIRKKGVIIGSAANTKRAETIAALMQGASLMMIALNYDKGYALDENSDPLNPPGYVDRKVLRDSAVSKLTQAATLAAANAFTTDEAWANGNKFSNVTIAKIARTMAALTLAWYPRDDGENAAVNWAQVATFASQGMSTGSAPASGTLGDFFFNSDGYSSWISELMAWFDEISGGRVHTRVAHFMDPATQVDPYRLGVGSVQPNSPDDRMGDGSFGDASLVKSYTTVPATANAGTDFAWMKNGEVFRPDRGFYHQSNIGHIRYDASGNQDVNDVAGGYGIAPAISASQNDLIWAEALLRSAAAANLATITSLIDKTRVGRGGLTSSAVNAGIGSDADGPCMANGVLAKNGSPCTLWSMLLYENEIELLGLGPAPFYNHRHLPVLQATNWERLAGPNPNTIYNAARYIQGLIPGTPREMPVPYKELGVKSEALYTFGGTNPPKGAVP